VSVICFPNTLKLANERALLVYDRDHWQCLHNPGSTCQLSPARAIWTLIHGENEAQSASAAFRCGAQSVDMGPDAVPLLFDIPLDAYHDRRLQSPGPGKVDQCHLIPVQATGSSRFAREVRRRS